MSTTGSNNAADAPHGCVIITGAAGGLGAAAARQLTKAGVELILVDRDEVVLGALAAELGAQARVMDVADQAQWQEFAADLVAHGTPVGGVLLNAGVAGGGQPAAFDADRYRTLLGVNIDGVVFGLVEIGNLLRAQGSGRVVVTASLAGLTGVPFDPFYALTKHAVVGLVRSVHHEYAAAGVHVAAVCPGLADTAILGDAKNQLQAADYALLTPAEVAAVLVEQVLGQRSEPVTVVQVGREPAAYEFAGIPGPGTGSRRLLAGLDLGQ